MTFSAAPDDWAAQAAQSAFPVEYREVVAAAVVRAARTSARVTEAGLASVCGIEEASIRAWEDGTRPLTTVPAPQLEQLKSALASVGAETGIVADLDAGAWCDLVVLTIADGTDCTGLLADPLTTETAFRDLLTWALHGRVPARYARYVLPGALITDRSLTERAVAVLGSLRLDLLRW